MVKMKRRWNRFHGPEKCADFVYLVGEISGNQKADMLNENLGDMGSIKKGLL